jgi:hypothetical protein
MPDFEKRLRYFNGQFLQAQDFIDEQTYHMDRQRRHNRQFHTSGIAEGLFVTANTGSAQAEVGPGTAVDSEGRLIVLEGSRTVTLSALASQTVLLLISYGEVASDPATVGGGGETRWHERPNVEAVPENSAPPAGTHIRLARLVITQGGTVDGELDRGVRESAGVRVGDELELRRLTLSRSGVDASNWPRLSSGASGRADISGSLHVTRNLNVEGTIAGNIANGIIRENQLANNAVTTDKIRDNAVTANKLRTRQVARGQIQVAAGRSERIPVSDPIPFAEAAQMPYLLVRAFSRTPNALFSWSQGADTTDNQVRQILSLRNEGQIAAVIEYEVHAIVAE